MQGESMNNLKELIEEFLRYLLIDKAKPINQVKDILRHNNINTTIKYLTTSQNEINEIRINILNGF